MWGGWEPLPPGVAWVECRPPAVGLWAPGGWCHLPPPVVLWLSVVEASGIV